MDRAAILDAFAALAEHRRHQALRIAVAGAFAIWDAYRKTAGRIEYMDGIVGMHHTVDVDLPRRALDEVDRKLAGHEVDPKATDHAYTEPIVAMQDDDLDFPERVAIAYYAIYNLHRLVFRIEHHAGEDVVLSQAAGNDVAFDDWLAEWWTRVWDAWATEPELYPASAMTEPVFRALCAWDLESALAALGEPAHGNVAETSVGVSFEPSRRAVEASRSSGSEADASRLRAVIHALAGRLDTAIAEAAGVLGVDTSDPQTRAWLERIVPSLHEAVAMTERAVAFCFGERLEVRARATGATRLASTFGGGHLRCVRFSRDETIVWVAGERVDRIGAFATYRSGEELDARDPGLLGSAFGRRRIAALGATGIIAFADEREVTVLGSTLEVLGEACVVEAAFADDDDLLATRDDTKVWLWHRDRGCLWMRVLHSPPRRLRFDGQTLLVLCSDGSLIPYDVS